MDFGCGGSAGGSGGGNTDQGLEGSEGTKRKWNDLEATMKAVKDAVVKENAELSAKIRRLMQDKVRLEETVLRLENPSPTSPQNPFAVFPQQVWEMVIKKINRSSDLEMLRQAFPQLEPLVMKTKRTIVLFKKVIPLVGRWQNLGCRDLFKYRLVCESWNEDLCAVLASAIVPNLLPVDALSNIRTFARTPHAYHFRDHEKIQHFLTKMADHPGNPLIGRSLCLSFDDKTELIQFWQSVLELVRKYGEYVWNLEIEHLWGPANQIDFYKAVQETLIHVPNLKYLTVEGNFTGPRPSNSQVAVQIVNSPVPPLPYLQSLRLDFSGETGMSNAFSSLFSSQLRRLQLRNESFGNLKVECLRGLINLEFLDVELQSKEDVSRLLKFPNPNIKKLRLYATVYSKPPVSFTSEQFASLLEKFSRLEHRLDITCCQGVGEPISSLGSRMRFSGLKTLEIEVGIGKDDRQQNLDFLLWFSSLKHLVIEIFSTVRTFLRFDEYDNHSTLKIRYYLIEGQMLNSNIWILMPSLQLLESRVRFHTPEEIIPRGIGIYTREMFENRVG